MESSVHIETFVTVLCVHSLLSQSDDAQISRSADLQICKLYVGRM